MSSWFSSFESATEALNKFGESLAEELPSFEDASDVLNKMPSFDTAAQALSGMSSKALNNELVSKLALRSDELKKEHELLDAQEMRKELVREYLSELLPWETKDESKEILVEQCQEAILKLSSDRGSFETPFMLQEGRMFNVDYYIEDEVTFENNNDNNADADADANNAKEQNDDVENNDDGESTRTQMTPEEKLEKMQPLPLLLEHFDIDTHVGLIERVMKADENLVYMHSMLSGAGEKELLFWKNYFFHCAYTRYQAGLSIEEIWSSKPKAMITGNNKLNTSGMNTNETKMDDYNHEVDDDDDDDVELDFDDEEYNDDDETSQSDPGAALDLTKSRSYDGSVRGEGSMKERTRSDSASDFEIVNEAIANIDDSDDLDDLDDLEAEIARELGED